MLRAPGAAVRLRATRLLASNLRATVFLAVLAGLAGASVTAAFAAARRSDSVIERYTEHRRTGDIVVAACTRGYTEDDLNESRELQNEVCFGDRAVTSTAAELRSFPGVEAVGRQGTYIASIVDPASPGGALRTLVAADLDTGLAGLGAPLVVRGRLSRPEAVDEITVNEDLADAVGLAPGDTTRLATYASDELVAASDGSLPPRRAGRRVVVTGVVRDFPDLLPKDTSGLVTVYNQSAVVYTTPAWWAAEGPDVASYGVGALVRLTAGPGGVGSFRAELGERFADRAYFTFLPEDDTDIASIEEATGIEAKGLLLLACGLVVAAARTVGSAIRRQTVRELADGPILVALGARRRDTLTAVALRIAPVAGAAAILAATGALALSSLGTVGVSRRAEFQPGVRADGPVLLLGALATALLVVGVGLGTAQREAWRSSVRVAASRGDRRSPRRAVRAAWVGRTPASAYGAALVRGTGRGGRPTQAAALGAVVAVAVALTGAVAVASFDRVSREPERFGATWDLQVGNFDGPEQLAAGLALARANPAVDALAALETSSIVTVDGVGMPVLAYDGNLGPAVIDGRAPSAPGEVALGRLTAEELGVGLGDTVTLEGENGQRLTSVEAIVVGRVIVADTLLGVSPGRGAVVAPETFTTLQDLTTAQTLVLRLGPEIDRATAVASVAADFPFTTDRPSRPNVLRNLARLRSIPAVLAIAVAFLAAIGLAHALGSAAHARRADLAALRAMGATRQQTARALIWCGGQLGAVGIALGLALGVIGGRQTWRLVNDRVGLASGPVWPWAPVAVVLGAAAVVVLAVASWAGWMATRVAPGAVLRSE